MNLALKNVSIVAPNSKSLLQDADHVFTPGVTALLGSNGAGKSTLLRAIATVCPIAAGQISINELDSKRQRIAYLERLMFLPQTFHAYPQLTASEFLQYFLRLRGADTAHAASISHAWLQRVNLADARKLRIGAFSQGMLQRLGLAYALQIDALVYVLDEPFAGVDRDNRLAMISLLHDLGQNKVVIVSTHHLDEMKHICGHLVSIKDGRLVS